MTGFIRASDGLYYEGDREHALDLVVPQRPGPFFKWDGQTWQPGADPRAAAPLAAARQSSKTLTDLSAAIEAGDTIGALRLVQQLLQQQQGG